MLKGMAIIVGTAVMTAFTFNFFSPQGIALSGDWDPTMGVVTAKAKNDVVDHEREIQEIIVAKGLYGKNGVVFVDARPRVDFDEGRISGAVSIPINEVDEYLETFLETYPLESHVITYCSGRECNDSHIVADILADVGYSHVQVFVDGFPAWKEEGYPVD